MRIECNGDRVSMSKNEYRQVMNKQNDYKQQRDSLIKDIKKLRKDSDKYNYLTNYIKDKAIHNPSVSRYIDLVHVIDELERDTHEGN